MVVIKQNWTDFKTTTAERALSIQWYVENNKYRILAFDENLQFKTEIYINSPVVDPSDQKDFEDNFKSGANKKIVGNSIPAFASNVIGGKLLFKRVHGVSASINAGETGNLDFSIPYAEVKFTGAEIFGTELGDVLDFTVHDDANNTYTGAPGSHQLINQFGFNVQLPKDKYKNTSNYDADLFYNMLCRCSYTNNGTVAKTVCLNLWLHEVK